MARDSLRATLDDLRLDEQSAKERPYLEAMLRRLGYTDVEIRAELGPPVEASPPLPQDFGVDDQVAPAREYRLVVPARESAFSFENPTSARGSDSPFEALDRVEFEETSPVEDTVEFTEIPAEPDLEFIETPAEEFAASTLEEFEDAPVQELQADESLSVEDVSIDTFGGPDVDTQQKTRVRVKRVRAKSKAEAEAKVASSKRKVIKSIPVDIVERWGAGGSGAKGDKK